MARAINQYLKFHSEKKHQSWKLLQQFATLEFPIRRSSWIKSLLALATWLYYQRHQVNWLRHFSTTVPQTRKNVTLTCFHYRYDLWYTSGCAETIRNPALLIAWHAAASSSSRTGEKSTSEPVEIDVLAPCMAACFLTCLERVFHPQTSSCKLYMWMLDKHSRNGNLSRHQQGSIPDHWKLTSCLQIIKKLLLFPFQIQVFKQMGASFQVLIIFSGKTNPWVCWVCTTILVRNPQISSNFQLSPAPPRCKVGQRPSMCKALPSNTGGLMASTRAKLTVWWFWRKIWTPHNYLKIDGFPLKYFWKKTDDGRF